MLPIIIAAKSGNWHEVNLSEVTLDEVNHLTYEGGNLLHNAAREGQLKNFPRNLLNTEGLLAKDNEGNTVLHTAAKFDELFVIPKPLLNSENLEITNKKGETIFHHIAARGRLREIPEELLTDRTLSLTNNMGKSSLDCAMDTWVPNRKTLHSELMKKTIKIILTKLGDERLKYAAKKYQEAINAYEKKNPTARPKSAKEENDPLLKDRIAKKNLICKEILKRSLIDLKKDQTIGI